MSLGLYTSVEVDRNRICYRGRDDQGREIRETLPYKPSLFVPSPNGTHTTYNGEKMGRIQFGSIKEAREYVKRYEEVSNFTFYGNTNYQYAFISDKFPKTIVPDPNIIQVWKLDIEVASENGFPEPDKANEEVTAITIKTNKNVVCFGCGEFTPENGEIYIRCDSEIEMLEKFIQFWEKRTPDVVTGWYVTYFDIPYLVNRIKRLYGNENAARRLSPWKNIRERNVEMLKRDRKVYEILGVAILDYNDLYRKFAKDGTSRESYNLGYIAQIEIGKTKLEGTDGISAFNLYKTDFQTFMEYNIRDVMLIEWMDNKLKLMELAYTLAYNAKCNLDDVLFQTRMWDCLTFKQFVEDKMVFPQKKRSDREPFEGAYVKNPLPGWWNNVAGLDLTSLYPHLIMQYNISPEMMLENPPAVLITLRGSASVEALLNKEIDLSALKTHNVCMTPNGMFFRTDIGKGFMPKLMETMFNQRKKAKDEMLEWEKKLQTCKSSEKEAIEIMVARLNNLQLAIKVSLNSAYGSFSNPGFRFYDHRLGLAITSAGKLSILWVGKHINHFLNDAMKNDAEKDYILASDTDSMYLWMHEILEKYCGIHDTATNINNMDMICEKVLKPTIERIFMELKDYTNALEQKMEMKREALCDIGIWTSKKHYILNIWNNEGVAFAEPKLKIVGLEAVKASAYPKIPREVMKKIYKEMVTSRSEEKVQDMIAKFEKEFMKLPIKDIALPTGVNGISEYEHATKSVPIHVKASLVHNRYIKEKNIDKDVKSIKDGEKIKYVLLKSSNPMQSHVIAFQEIPPKEFELERWIDYNRQFSRTFLEPVKTVLDAIGWSHEPRNELF